MCLHISQNKLDHGVFLGLYKFITSTYLTNIGLKWILLIILNIICVLINLNAVYSTKKKKLYVCRFFTTNILYPPFILFDEFYAFNDFILLILKIMISEDKCEFQLPPYLFAASNWLFIVSMFYCSGKFVSRVYLNFLFLFQNLW